ncbi:blue light receptor [Tulasnella sp. 418]|nr:blue light receptor [Tulasnella sp. 418]
MMGILARVASRPNPQIVLGPVDFSCSFVLVDVRRYDHPIVYASPTFLKLTGYEANEVVGRNCRFLQAPDGNVPRGSQRAYTDPDAVGHINKSLLHNKECQANLMNYRKGGQPFLNLVSIVPIPWDADSDEIRYHVGFQVDLVHQPNAILQTMKDGTYMVNYSSMMSGGPAAGLGAPGHGRGLLMGQSSISKELREVMADILPGGMNELENSSDEKNRHELNALLLDQSDDFVHVLSVKGIIQYASPSLLRVLEYTSEELIGKHLSDIAHPQDLTPITRELKESSTSQKLVRLLFRARRKHSGMVWLESSGRLHLEPGKTRKSVVFGGRVREISKLRWNDVDLAGGVGDNEFWAKISVGTGLVVWASEPSKEVLRRQVGEKSKEGRDEEGNAIIGTRLKDLIVDQDWEVVKKGMENACIAAGVGEGSIIVPAKFRIPSKETEYGAQHTEVETELVMYVPDLPMGTYDKPLPPSETTSYTSTLRLAPPKPSSLLIQFRLKSPVSLSSPRAPPSKKRKLVHSTSSAVYEELDISRASNWCYEVERVKQVNERMKGEIAALENSMNSRLRSETV